MAAPPGTELPFGGIRLFAKDHQRGRNVTYCVTMEMVSSVPTPGGHCCWGEVKAFLPERLRHDVESLRVAVSGACGLDTELWRRMHPKIDFRTGVGTRAKTTFEALGVPERLDDKLSHLYGFLGCVDIPVEDS